MIAPKMITPPPPAVLMSDSSYYHGLILSCHSRYGLSWHVTRDTRVPGIMTDKSLSLVTNNNNTPGGKGKDTDHFDDDDDVCVRQEAAEEPLAAGWPDQAVAGGGPGPGARGLSSPLPPRPLPESELLQPRAPGPALLVTAAPDPEVILPWWPRHRGEAARLSVPAQLPGPHLRPRTEVWHESQSPASPLPAPSRRLEPKNVLQSVLGPGWPLRHSRDGLWAGEWHGGAPLRRGGCSPTLGHAHRAPHFRIGRHQSFKFRKK